MAPPNPPILSRTSPDESGARNGVQGYASALLRDSGVLEVQLPVLLCPPAALDWAASGAMALSGEPGAPPALAPGPVTLAARAALSGLWALAPRQPRVEPETWVSMAPTLLAERAALAGFERAGRQSPGGSCRLLRCKDDWIALNLARLDDIALLPAWLETAPPKNLGSGWDFATPEITGRSSTELVRRGRLMGLPVAPVPDQVPCDHPWLTRTRQAAPRPVPPAPRPLVVDLSSLWAGPLAGHLLGLLGCRVIKVESTHRPDAARRGCADFFDLLNFDKEMVALDFRSVQGREKLVRLLAAADIVIESSRPRALLQLGIDAAEIVAGSAGKSWLSITGYGRSEPESGWVAFGDDAAAAAGYCKRTGAALERPLFCGDAIADPLTGMHAALAALASHRSGGGEILDVALCNVAAHVLTADACSASPPKARVRPLEADGWEVVLDAEPATPQRVLAPTARPLRGRAGELGADTQRVLNELAR